MRAGELSNSDAFEAEGIRMEIWEPDFIVLPIPVNERNANTPISLKISVTNNSPIPIHFSFYDTWIPQLLDSNSCSLHWQEPLSKQLKTKKSSTFNLLRPGSALGHSLQLKLSQRNQLLLLEVLNQPSYSAVTFSAENSWSITSLQPDTYQLRFRYHTEIKIAAEIKPVQLVTQFVNLRLVEPVASDNSAVEVDGIRFEALVPERILPIKNKSKNKKRGDQPLVQFPTIQFGIRVTNQTPTSHRFIFFGLMPELQDTDGQVIPRGYARNATKTHTESDYLLAMPGESLTYLLDAEFYWWENQLHLRGYEDSGGIWHFHDLKPGSRYRVRFTYNKCSPLGKVYEGGKWRKVCDDVWTGKVYTPFVEFLLAKP